MESEGGKIMRTLGIAIVATLIAVPAMAQDQLQEIKLKPGPGLDKVEHNCATCHSLAYIPMNSPFLNEAGWNAEVTKMIKALGAPINGDDAKAIVEYLAKNYGT
jgi:sulfite dehydrogenase (cytochrome) subunit B